MSDPRKNFVCPKCRTVINDMDRYWGNETPCRECGRKEMLKRREGKNCIYAKLQILNAG